MPKSPNQKAKLLYLKKIFEERTDEFHPLTTNQLIAALSQYDISAERKSVYDDIEQLIRFGMDIEVIRSKANAYYLASRDFELPELKLLADAVASSKFITEKKSGELIKKIESLVSTHDASQLRRQVIVSNRVKTMNEKIYYNVDAIHEAIAKGRQIAFLYFQYNIHLQKEYKYGSEKYIASPYALSWDDENYYLVAYYERSGIIANFRVDKMERIELLDKPRVTPPKDFNIASYSKKQFSMFGGEDMAVTLRFNNDLIGVVIDRFGKDTFLTKGNGWFTAHVNVNVSNTFLSWMFQFGNRAEILSPPAAVERARRLFAELMTQYHPTSQTGGQH